MQACVAPQGGCLDAAQPAQGAVGKMINGPGPPSSCLKPNAIDLQARRADTNGTNHSDGMLSSSVNGLTRSSHQGDGLQTTILCEICCSSSFAKSPSAAMLAKEECVRMRSHICAAAVLQGWKSNTNGTDLWNMLQQSFGWVTSSGYTSKGGLNTLFPVVVGEFGSSYVDDLVSASSFSSAACPLFSSMRRPASVSANIFKEMVCSLSPFAWLHTSVFPPRYLSHGCIDFPHTLGVCE